MAPNRQTELKHPSSSSSEEEESDSQQTSDSESQKPTPSSLPHPLAAADSGSDSDSDSPPTKPLDETPTKKPTPSLKRPADSNPNRPNKKPLLQEDEPKDDQKKQLFQRLWSEDDEIVILKGILDYVALNGTDPSNDLAAFHDFIKKSLHIDVTRAQLQDKVRRLKKKFGNNVSKEKVGKDRVFSKAHEQKAYDLSKMIWGPDGKLLGVVENSKTNGSVKKRAVAKSPFKVESVGAAAGEARHYALPVAETRHYALPVAETRHYALPVAETRVRRNVRFGRGLGDSSLESEILDDGLELLEPSNRVEMEEKWKALRVEEYQLYLKRVQLIKEQTELVLEGLKSSGN